MQNWNKIGMFTSQETKFYTTPLAFKLVCPTLTTGIHHSVLPQNYHFAGFRFGKRIVLELCRNPKITNHIILDKDRSN